MSKAKANLWIVFWPVQILALLGIIFTSFYKIDWSPIWAEPISNIILVPAISAPLDPLSLYCKIAYV